MKKYLISTCILIVSVFFITEQHAGAQTRADARAFLGRTRNILERAKDAVRFGHVYTGDLVKAVQHQRYAKELLHSGRYRRAIFHSYRARELARMAMRANHRRFNRDAELLASERPFVRAMPRDRDLDLDIRIPAGETDQTVIRER